MLRSFLTSGCDELLWVCGHNVCPSVSHRPGGGELAFAVTRLSLEAELGALFRNSRVHSRVSAIVVDWLHILSPPDFQVRLPPFGPNAIRPTIQKLVQCFWSHPHFVIIPFDPLCYGTDLLGTRLLRSASASGEVQLTSLFSLASLLLYCYSVLCLSIP